MRELRLCSGILIVTSLLLVAVVVLLVLPVAPASRPDFLGGPEGRSTGLSESAGGPETTPDPVPAIQAVRPLSFEANRGQTDPRVKFLARGGGATLFLASSDFVLKACGSEAEGDTATCQAVEMSLVGARSGPEVTGDELLPGVSNYLIGNDAEGWQTNVPHYARVHYEQVYEGIDLVFHGTHGSLEYDFIVAPGFDPAAIRLTFSSAEDLAIDEVGNLVISTQEGELLQHAPVIYQESKGEREIVRGRYVLTEHDLVGFEVGPYDTSRPLVIDPLLSYSTYLGGAGWDAGQGIAVDRAGHAYVVGDTESADFPTVTAFDGTHEANRDAFVVKLAPGGGTLVFATYLGGSGSDTATDVVLDSGDSIYMTGFTSSWDFPTYQALQGERAGSSDAFMVKMDPSGSALIYSTYHGGSDFDYGQGIAVDPAGYIYLFGETKSSDFPLSSPLYDRPFGGQDLFVTKLPAMVNYLYWSTYLGGSEDELAMAIAVDDAGNAYVTGRCPSSDFPTANAHQPQHGGGIGSDAFVAKVHLMGWTLSYSTFLGGDGNEDGSDILVDEAGNAYVVGYTSSTNFPTLNAYQPELAGMSDATITKYAADGSMVYSTYLGGSFGDDARGVGMDRSGDLYVGGQTFSTDFPTIDAFQGELSAWLDLFVARLTRNAGDLSYSTYLGGSGPETFTGFAVDERGAAYITGFTESTNFPTVGAVQNTHGGDTYDAIVAKVTTPLDFFIAAALLPDRASSEGGDP
jgi:hypothetical protein